jgi:membrane-bound lytic murein transglycosylase F
MRRASCVVRGVTAALLILGASARSAFAQGIAIGKIGESLNEAAHERAMRKATTKYDATFDKYTKRYFGPGFDWHVFKAQAMAESQLNPKARSYVGARGLMQLMPSTFAAIQSKRPEFKSIDDPEWNIAAGIAHNRYLWKLYENAIPEAERLRFMLGSYNAGQGTIARAQRVADSSRLDRARWSSLEAVAPKVGRWRYTETLGYVKKIESFHSVLERTHK